MLQLLPRPLSGALLALAILPCPPAAAATSESQAWITESFHIKASDADVVTIDFSQRFRRDSSNGEQQLARIGIDHQIAKGIQLGGGLAYLHSEPEQELRLFQQVIASRGIWLARTRLEQRFFDTADRPSWRLRQRMQAAVPIDAGKKWTVVAAVEAMFHLNRARASDKTGLAVMRHQIGLRHALSKAMDVQLLYMRQQTFRDDRPDAVAHVPWATISWKI